MSLLQMMVSKLSWKEKIACESRRQPLADSPSPSRSSDQLMNVADTLSTLARVLDPLGGSIPALALDFQRYLSSAAIRFSFDKMLVAMEQNKVVQKYIDFTYKKPQKIKK